MRSMRLVTLVPLLLAACGGHSTPTASLSVTCDGRLELAGAASIDVVPYPGKGAGLSFPDPVNPGHTGTLPLPEGRACTIAPVLSTDSKTDKPAAG